MSARILVVDDLAPNVNLLQVKLQAEYYDVLTARSGYEALEVAENERLDLILMDAMMPGMDGFEACRRIKNNPATWHVPVIMVTALEETKDRIRGLEAGADDFVTKPIDDFNIMARVRSLLRLKMVTDQLLSHTGHTLSNSRSLLETIEKQKGRILLVEDHERHADKIAKPLSEHHQVIIEKDPTKALVIGDPEDETRFIRAYDIGINDTIMRPIEIQELKARVKTLMRRKFYAYD